MNYSRMNACKYRLFGMASAVALALVCSAQGCVSVQLPTCNGHPYIIGFGWSKALPVKKGEIYQIIAPGLSFRLHRYAPGVSLGWSETLLFYPSCASQSGLRYEPLAIQDNCTGINLAPWQTLVGYQRLFTIPLTAQTRDVIQVILYSENDLTNTIIQLKEKQ